MASILDGAKMGAASWFHALSTLDLPLA